MGISVFLSVLFISFLGIPICYVVNTASTLHGESGLLISGVAAITLVFLLAQSAVSGKNIKDPLFYLYMTGTFTSVASLIIALEADGHIKGYMSRYFENGEPYLKTPHGTLISYWDGTGHYVMYVMMIYAISRGCSYRELGLYWIGSLGHSMMVFVPGIFAGKYGVRPSFLLNLPWVILPFVAGFWFLKARPVYRKRTVSPQHLSLFSRPMDIILILCLVASFNVILFRGFAALGAENELFATYMKDYEPYLLDDEGFSKIQMIIYLFYFVPYYCMAIYGLICPGCTWMPDWAMIHAGAAAQAQVAHIGSALHPRTPDIFRIPGAPDIRLVFWIINLGLFFIPQILAYRCGEYQSFFYSQASKTNKSNKDQ